MDHAAIDDYLARYAQTLARFDATAAAGLWAEPGMIVDDRFSGVLDDRAAMARGLERSYPLYRALGLASVGHELLDTTFLTGAIALVHVRWLFRDAEGAPLTDSTAYYIVREEDDGLHACVCVQVDDAAKLQALAAARGVDLAQFLPDGPPA
ncbi:hypothetical protein AXK57_17920 [Tsukamurella pulmonis]|uniref:hypothetical protein n=1 Tax=Tsukamurella pulmonis TaxID=47312 RepID=UPI000793CA33|nr:hypothetical protein [Tsukamurella pulmonis]KXP08330.1 hypothetical protein AXK57_17920 [Tsukamurella pulmonis]